MSNVSPLLPLVLTAVLLASAFVAVAASDAQDRTDRNPVYWEVHDEDRPQPPRVNPGPSPVEPSPVPSDAVVLFDGSDLAEWGAQDGSLASWVLEDGLLEVAPGTGDLQTREGFGDVQLHVEWRAPADVEGEGQGRGNSGIFVMGLYEVQVLESHDSQTYPDGQAAAIYGQYPPLVNAMRPPGEWQIYDIHFQRPRFDEHGEVARPAKMTVFHNGILVQDGVELTGPVGHYQRPRYEAHDARLPLRLQDHGDRVQFRQIWVRDLEQ
jgi:hypothetical protein